MDNFCSEFVELFAQVEEAELLKVLLFKLKSPYDLSFYHSIFRDFTQ